MAKATRGGKRVTIQIPVTPPVTPPTPPTPAPEEPENTLPTVDEFDKMSIDEKADVIAEAISKDVPDFFNDNSFERLAYNLEGIDGKPAIADDSSLDSMKGTELFRTVNDTYDRKNDVNYTAKQIYNQIAKGTNTRASNSGGSAYGRGLYFAHTYTGSTAYAGSPGKSLVMRAKITSGKGINAYTASSNAASEIARGTKLGKVLAKCDSTSRSAIWARANGYSYMDDGYNDYYVVIDRRCLTMSSKTKQPTGRTW